METETINKLLQSIQEAEEAIENFKKAKAVHESELSNLLAGNVAEQLADKEYCCGTATILTDKYKIKAVITKNVEYDQKQLGEIFERIKAANENPLEYMKVKYDVGEAAYKNWPSNIKAVFEPARSVEPSKVKITFEKINVE